MNEVALQAMLQQRPAGLLGKDRQAVAAKTGDWSTCCSSSSGEEDKKSKSQEAEIKELRAQFQCFRKQRGEAGQEGQSGPARRQSCLEEDWGMEVEEEFENGENRRKLDEQRMRLQKELRDVEKLSFIPQVIQRGLKEGVQQQLQDIEQKSHDLLPQHQRVQKRSQKIQSIQVKKRNLPQENVAAREEMRKLKDCVKQNEECVLCLSDKVEKNERAESKTEAVAE